MNLKYIFITLTLLANTSFNNAQELRIPFRVGDKFGLSNEEGEIKVEAEYDEIDFMEETFQYFQYTNIIHDSIESVYGGWESDEKYSTGVIYHDRVILKDKSYRSFRVYNENFIVGSWNNDQRPENCMLYNLKGEELLDSEMKSIYFNYDGDVGKLRYANPNLILISIFHHDKSRKYKFSLASYDVKKQEIKQWILKEVSGFDMIDELGDKNAILFQYSEDNKQLKKEILYYDSSAQNFKIGPLGIALPDFDERGNANRIASNPESVSKGSIFDGDDSYLNLEERYAELDLLTLDERDNDATKYPLFTFYSHNRVYHGDNPVAKIPNAKFFKQREHGQKQPVIYEVDSKYGLILSDTTFTTAKYDSLFYINGDFISVHRHGFLYLVGKKNDSTWKFGVINHLEEVIVPIEYDQLIPFVPALTWDFYQNHYGKPLDYSTVKNKTFYDPRIDGMVGEKNGRVGLINLNYEVYFPFEYDGFYTNELAWTHPVDSKGDYVIVEKEGKFAIIKNLSISPEQLKKKFAFPYMPASYYLNYGGKIGFHLFNLVTKEGTFCYAREDGFIYYKE